MITATGAMQTALAAATAEPAHLMAFDFATGIERICTWEHELTWGGFTWTPTGGLISIDDMSVWTTGGGFPSISLLLSGIDSTRLDDVINQSRGRILTWYLAMVEAGAVVVDALEYGQFRMVPGPIHSGRGRLSVEVGLESRASVSRVRAPRTRSNSDQTQLVDATDDCFIDAGLTHRINRENLAFKSGL